MSPRPRSAMILGAGLGTRMRPLTDDRPKPLVELAGRALIDRTLAKLQRVGVLRVVVNVHYRADQLEAHLAGRKYPDVLISNERAGLLDTGGGVGRALDLLGAGPFFIHNCDTFWIDGEAGAEDTLERMVALWDPDRMDSLLLLADPATSIGYDGPGDFICGADGRLSRGRAEGGNDDRAAMVFAGVSIADRRLFDDAPGNAYSLNVLWDRAIAAGRLFGLGHQGTWMHIGSPAALAEAERILQGEAWR